MLFWLSECGIVKMNIRGKKMKPKKIELSYVPGWINFESILMMIYILQINMNEPLCNILYSYKGG